MFKKGNHWKVLVSIENHPLRSPSVCQAVRSIVWSPLACSHEIYAYVPNNHEMRYRAKGEGRGTSGENYFLLRRSGCTTTNAVSDNSPTVLDH